MKANELSCRDLMVGDWVRIKITQHNTTVTNIDANSVYTETAFPIRYAEIEPIPLTPEILEKNGFLCEQDRWWWQDFYITLASTKALTLVCNRTIQIEYVHQLQHALRLCEIEKTIEL